MMGHETEEQDELEVIEEEDLDSEEVTEVTQLQQEMRTSLEEVRKGYSGVTSIAEELRRALAAKTGREVRRSLTPREFPAVGEKG